MIDRRGADELFAEVYRDACLAGVDIRELAADLEPVRAGFRRDQRLVEPWRALGAAIAGRFPDPAIVEALVRLRGDLLGWQLAAEAQLLDHLLETEPPEAERRWVADLADGAHALGSDTLEALGRIGAERPGLDQELARLAVEAGAHIDAQRFAELRPFVERLAADHRLSAIVRAELTAILGLVALFVVEDVPTVRRLIVEATAIDHESSGLAVVVSDLEGKLADWASADAVKEAHLRAAEPLLARAREAAVASKLGEGTAVARVGDWCLRLAAHLERTGRADEAPELYRTAEERYREAIGIEPWEPTHLRSLATHLIRRGAPPDDPEVARLTQLSYLLEPRDVADMDSALGSALLDAGHTEEAAAAFARALAREPGNLDAVAGQVVVLQATSRLDEAQRWLDEAERASPGTFEVARLAAWTAESQSRFEDALRLHTLALGRRPEAEAAVRADRAWSHQQLGDQPRASEEAVAACRSLLDRDDREGPAVAPATARLLDAVDAESAAGRPDEALAHLDVVRELRGDDFEADFRNRRGVVLHDAGRYEEAVAEYEQAAALGPQVAQHWHNLGLARRALGRLDEAVDAAERACAIDGDVARRDRAIALVWNDRGNTAYSAGDLTAAIDAYRQAVPLSPDDVVLRTNLAGALLDAAASGDPLGWFEEAAGALEPVAATDPGAASTLAWVRRAQAVAQLLDASVVSELSFDRLRVVLPPALVPVFVDEQGQLLPEVNDALSRMPADVGFGRSRPAVRFREATTESDDAVEVWVNGAKRQVVAVEDRPDPVLAALDELIRSAAGAFLGVDDAQAVVAASERTDVQAVARDPDGLAIVTTVLREQAAPGAQLADAIPVLQETA